VRVGLASIVIVGYNNWPDLEMAIQSALSQSHEPVEVIVVDNDSSDETSEEVPRRFGERIRYIRQNNRRDSGAYNTGYRVAQGEFIQFLAGDDVLAPNKIEKQIQIFRENPDAQIVYGDIRTFNDLPGPARWSDHNSEDYEDMLAALLHPQQECAEGSVLGTLFHRTAVERIGPWDESLYTADADYWLRGAWIGCRFRRCPGALVGFSRERPGQMTADSSAMMHGIEDVWTKAMSYIDREPYRSMLSRKLARVRYYLAISKDGMTLRESLAKLEQSRQACPSLVSFPIYLIGGLLIVLPGGRHLVTAARLRFLRRAIARALGYDLPRALCYELPPRSDRPPGSIDLIMSKHSYHS
jgi:glycosyltransferase involved in cell wall biosynthesis